MDVQELLDCSNKALVGVHPVLRDRVIMLIRGLHSQGLDFGAFMGLRTFAQQDALYAQGRTKPGPKVTNAKGGDSFHNYGLAIDIVEDGDPNRAGIQWSWENNKHYLLIGGVAKALGLEWGGFWKSFTDTPHVQITGGLTLSQVKTIYKQGGLPAVWAEVDKRIAA